LSSDLNIQEEHIERLNKSQGFGERRTEGLLLTATVVQDLSKLKQTFLWCTSYPGDGGCRRCCQSCQEASKGTRRRTKATKPWCVCVAQSDEELIMN
jgi:hypothetical protein